MDYTLRHLVRNLSEQFLDDCIKYFDEYVSAGGIQLVFLLGILICVIILSMVYLVKKICYHYLQQDSQEDM